MRRILRKIAAKDFENFGDISTLLNSDIVEYLIKKQITVKIINSSLVKGYAKIVLALVFWASLYHIAPLPLMLCRHIPSWFDSLCLCIVDFYCSTLPFYKDIFSTVESKSMDICYWCRVFWCFLYNVTFLWAEKLISGNIVAIIYAFTPCLITILSSYLFKMKVNQQAKKVYLLHCLVRLAWFYSLMVQ